MKKSVFFYLLFLFAFNINVLAQAPKGSDKSIDQFVYAKIDYNRLPDDVKQKINANKLADKSLFDGVARAYIADIKGINAADDIKSKLPFLSNISECKEVKYLSGNRVEIVTRIDIEATFFKELFLVNDVSANFIEQKFIVYDLK
jgi:hypothetical protein